MGLFQKIYGTRKSHIPAVADKLSDGNNKPFNKSLCFAPSVNMIFSEDGTVKACCHNKENLLGRYPEQKISEIWNGIDANEFRRKMSEFQFLSGCQVCSRDYDSGNFDEMMARHFDTIPRHPSYPSMMEFMFDNTCNLECIMCTGELSSSIRRNRDKLPALKSPYSEDFIEQLDEFIPHLVETRFSSAGEAFLIDLNYTLWEKLIARNPKCMIVVQTNGTVLNARVKDFLTRGNFKIGVSLDSLQKDTFEAIRVNASFGRIMENIRYFAAYSEKRNQPFSISTCVMRQNWKELPDFVHFCNGIGATITFHKVWTPLQYSLHNLPAVELRNIYNRLLTYQFEDDTALKKKNKSHYTYFVSIIKAWLTDAEKLNTNEKELQELSTKELTEQIKVNLRTYVTEQTMLDRDKQQLILQCDKKIDDILSLCPTEESKRVRLLLLCATPVSISLPAIKIYSAEKLYEMSVNQVKQA